MYKNIIYIDKRNCCSRDAIHLVSQLRRKSKDELLYLQKDFFNN